MMDGKGIYICVYTKDVRFCHWINGVEQGKVTIISAKGKFVRKFVIGELNDEKGPLVLLGRIELKENN